MANMKGLKPGSALVTAIRDYRIVSALDEGGSGRVLLVVDEEGRELAAKVLDPNKSTSDKRKRFVNELQFGLRNTHPNIVTLLDSGVVELDGRHSPFYIMPRYKGTLREAIRAGLQPERALQLFVELLDGLEAAHLRRIWHRDLKPANILVNDPPARVAIADWGCAHFSEEELHTLVNTAPHSRLASFQYAAPEQRSVGAKVDHRADIFSLGLIVNEMFTKEVIGGTGHKAIGAIAKDYKWLDAIVDSMVSQSPEARPTSVDEIKTKLMSESRIAVSRQKLSEVESMVVDKASPDDRITSNPIRLVDFDWRDGVITLVLNQSVTPEWVQAFQGIDYRTAIWGKDPISFQFSGTKAINQIDTRQAQDLIDHFKRYLELANAKYLEVTARRLRAQEESERQAIQEAAKRERERLAVLSNLRI